MADILQLRGSPHEQTQGLLPWYASDTLDPEEKALVEEHLPDCAECRAELESERLLAIQVATLPMGADGGWAIIDERIDSAPPRAAAPVRILKRRIPLGWAIAAQAAAAVLLLSFLPASPRAPANQTYHALGSAPAGKAGNIVIVFQPEASERDMRAALLKTGASVVDGPNATGAYMLRVAANARPRALEQLRQVPQVVLAEPIDGDEHP
jgi:hypothetical protein